MQKLNR